MAKAILLGIGHLTWCSTERRSDRYGSVFLLNPSEGDGGASGGADEGGVSIPVQEGYGQLVAKVVEPRESQHIGDLFHNIFPSLPKKGERIVLGSGMAFSRTDYEREMVGVKPIDGRTTWWLNPKNLFRAHSSIVELYWIPKPTPTNVKEPRKRKSNGFTMIVQNGIIQGRED